MNYTIACILCTTLLGVLFKWSEQYKARAKAIIPINYFICFITGFFHTGSNLFEALSLHWLPFAAALGCLFIIGFRYFARTIELAGLPIAALFQKMSVILTVPLAVLFGDQIGIYQTVGLFFGILSIFMIIGIRNPGTIPRGKYTRFLLGSLIIASCIEISFILIDKTFHFTTQLKLIFPSYVFLVSGFLGLLFLLFHKSPFRISKTELAFGIALGIPNFYSIHFMMMALDFECKGPVFFPILNCSTIALSGLIGTYIFHEKLNRYQMAGIALSMISIFLLFYFKR